MLHCMILCHIMLRMLPHSMFDSILRPVPGTHQMSTVECIFITFVGTAIAKKVKEWHFFWGRQVYFSLGWKNILSFGAFTKLRKATVSFVVSVRLSSCNNSALTGRILMKFDSYWDFFENLSTWFKFYENPTRITDTLHEDVFTFMTLSC